MTTASARLRVIASTLALTYVALMPFDWTLPGNMQPIDLLVPVLGILLLKDGALQHTFGRLTSLDWCVLGLLVAMVPSLLVTPDLRTSLLAAAKRIDVAATFVVFAAYFQRFGVRPAMSVLAGVAVTISVLCVIAAAVYLATSAEIAALGHATTLPYIGTVLRAIGGTGTPAMLGNYLTVAWPVACVLAWQSRHRGWWIGGLAVMTAAMALSFSHAVAGFAVAAIVVGWPWFAAPGWRTARAAAVAAVALLVVAMNLMLIVTVRDLSWIHDRDREVARVEHSLMQQSAEGADRVTVGVSYNPMSYFLLKAVALDAFRAHPLTGVGIGTFHRLTERAYESGVLSEFFRAVDPHSTMFGALAETGVLGGVATMALFVVALRLAPRSDENRWLFRAMQAGVAGLAINSVNADVLNFRFMWIGLAVLRALA